jgi:glycosyltransferase involved in cell wall biosynthesis
MEQYELTILMPCLNEAETIGKCILKAKKFLSDHKISGEILIADNGSTDGSTHIAKAHGAKVIPVEKRGYGAALKSGISRAFGDYIIMGDADDSYDFANLLPFLTKLREGFDLVIGNRFAGGIMKGAMPPLNRYIGNPILSLLGRVFFKTKIGDFHCGLRGFNRASFQKLNLQGDGMEFASEMIVKATLQDFKITEVPTYLFPDGRNRRPHLRPFRDGWRHLRLLLLLSPKWLFLYPGIFLMFFGSMLMCFLSIGPLEIGNIFLDIHTMLFAGLFMIVGAQAFCFAFFAKYIADFSLKTSGPTNYFFQALKHFTLERGLIVGFTFCLGGAIGAIYTFYYWMSQAFGALVPRDVMRVLIPSITFLIVGTQLIFASFFMSLIEMHYPNDRKS